MDQRDPNEHMPALEEQNPTQAIEAMEAIEPIAQESLLFHEQTIIAVRLADGRICVVLRWVCESLKLQPGSQVRKILRTATTANELVRVKVKTKGGRQTMPAITLQGFPVWMLSINPGEVEDVQLRSLILAYQTEAKDVLYQHFLQRGLLPPGPSLPDQVAHITQIPEILDPFSVEPFKPQEEPGVDATDEELAIYHEALSFWHHWKADLHTQRWRRKVAERQDAMESRIESMEEVVRSVLPRLGLSPQHQASVRAAIEELWKLTGRPRQALYYELNQAFRAAKYADIADDEWHQVARWLKTRIDAAR